MPDVNPNNGVTEDIIGRAYRAYSAGADEAHLKQIFDQEGLNGYEANLALFAVWTCEVMDRRYPFKEKR